MSGDLNVGDRVRYALVVGHFDTEQQRFLKTVIGHVEGTVVGFTEKRVKVHVTSRCRVLDGQEERADVDYIANPKRENLEKLS